VTADQHPETPPVDPDDAELIPAATVLLLREVDGDGMEVLMLRRNSKIAFGGMWVFPGGRVDDHEMIPGDVLTSAKTAAVREVEEETGLGIEADALVTWSYWVPPPMPAMTTKGPRRRFSTWFFVTPAPSGDVAIDHGEIHEDRWLSPTEALSQHKAGEIELAPPTWITLTQLNTHKSVAEAMAWANSNEPEEFRTKPLGKDPIIISWAGDVAYSDGHRDQDGPRHRLTLDPDGWVYERT
jgi:8-oxo-dGTP pyrophosphatase MutT (NUDIX family)